MVPAPKKKPYQRISAGDVSAARVKIEDGMNIREAAAALGLKCNALSRRLRPKNPVTKKSKAKSEMAVILKWAALGTDGPNCILRFPTRGNGRASSWFQLMVILESAMKSVELCVFAFTNKLLAKALVRAKSRGASVRVILDKRMAGSKHSMVGFLRSKGIEVRLAGGTMHDKYCVLDGKTLLHGSFNFSWNAAKKNKETISVTTDWQAVSFSWDFALFWGAIDPAFKLRRTYKGQNFFLTSKGVRIGP